MEVFQNRVENQGGKIESSFHEQEQEGASEAEKLIAKEIVGYAEMSDEVKAVELKNLFEQHWPRYGEVNNEERFIAKYISFEARDFEIGGEIKSLEEERAKVREAKAKMKMI